MKLLTIMLVLAVAATGAMAQTYGWEDGVGTALGTYGNVGGTVNVSDFAHTGDHSLYFWEEPIGSTPQVYVAWVYGLMPGDVVTGSAWFFDDTPDTDPSPDYYPRFRLYSHYSTNDIDEYAGYGGNTWPVQTYTTGIGWEEMGFEYAYGDGGPAPEATCLVITVRLYSSSSHTPPEGTDGWIDDITINAPAYADVFFPDREPVANEESTWGGVKNLYR